MKGVALESLKGVYWLPPCGEKSLDIHTKQKRTCFRQASMKRKGATEFETKLFDDGPDSGRFGARCLSQAFFRAPLGAALTK